MPSSCKKRRALKFSTSITLEHGYWYLEYKKGQGKEFLPDLHLHVVDLGLICAARHLDDEILQYK